MKVKELIEQLNQVTDKEVEVFVYYSGNHDLNSQGELAEIQFVDDDLGSRVDINCVDFT